MDKNHYLLAEEAYEVFKIEQSAMCARKLLKQALVIGASTMIISHNYPEREAPTDGDISIVRKLAIASPSAGIDLLDYKTITKYGCFSFKESGVIEEGCMILWQDEMVDRSEEEFKNLH